MKTLRIVCPTCGAHLDVDIDSGQARCRFCNEIFSLDTRRREPEMSDAEQAGYEFERGRQRASVEFTQGYADRMAEARSHMPAMDPEPVYVPEPVYEPQAPARQGLPIWALIVLWLVFPPAGMVATIVTLIRRSSINRNPSSAVGVLTIFMIFWLVIVLTAMVY